MSADPTADELRARAFSGAPAPEQDWDVLVAEPANALLLGELVADPRCPSRAFLLGSLYCLVGHSDRTDPRVAAAARAALASSDLWLQTWGRRVADVIARPEDFRRADWCGVEGLRSTPAG